MKLKCFLIALLCAGCTLVSYGQRKPSKPTTAKPTTAKTAATPKSRSQQPTAVIPNAAETLPNVEKTGGKPFMDVLRERENLPGIQREEIPQELLSSLLWAACGVTTTPENRTAMQTTPMCQIGVYVINESGIYRYEAETHELACIRNGHYSHLLTDNGQPSTDASIALFFVFSSGAHTADGVEIKEMEAGINCGAIMQNIALYCTNMDFASLPFAFSDAHKSELLKLINQPEAVIMYGMAIGRR
jgi:hypothetical protein